MSGKRICKTNDGRYVLEGHPDAAILAYTEHDEPPQEVLDEVEAKARKKPADKARAKPADKGASG